MSTTTVHVANRQTYFKQGLCGFPCLQPFVLSCLHGRRTRDVLVRKIILACYCSFAVNLSYISTS